MARHDFNNKTFTLVENSEYGRVSKGTVFEFKQEGSLVTAEYRGGGIVQGSIIALLNDDTLLMRYHCLTETNELKSGQATAAISLNELAKIQLKLHWKWLGENSQEGVSEYIEL